MSLATPTAPALYFDVFRQGLRDLSYVEGQNLILEPRYAGGKDDLLPELIADLERVGVDVIVAGPFAALRVAKQATTRIPIVMTPSRHRDRSKLGSPGWKRYRYYRDGPPANAKAAGTPERDRVDAKPSGDLVATWFFE